MSRLDTATIKVVELGGTVRKEPGGAVFEVQLSGTGVVDDDLQCLSDFPDAHTLLLANTQVTDGSFSHISGMSSIEILGMAGTQVTGRGIEVLSKAKNLHTIFLTGCTRFKDVGMEELAEGCVSIKNLFLAGCRRLTVVGLNHLASDALDSLKKLTLDDVPISDAICMSLGGHKTLQLLSLTGSGVEYGRAYRLSESASIRVLGLNENNIGDSSLERLRNIGSLKVLSLQETMVTAEGVQKFMQARDDIKIVY